MTDPIEAQLQARVEVIDRLEDEDWPHRLAAHAVVYARECAALRRLCDAAYDRAMAGALDDDDFMKELKAAAEGGEVTQ